MECFFGFSITGDVGHRLSKVKKRLMNRKERKEHKDKGLRVRLRLFAVFRGIFSPKRRKSVACVGLRAEARRATSRLGSLRYDDWPGQPQNCGLPPCGSHARRRAGARLTRRQPPHAGARALPETNPGRELLDATGNRKAPMHPQCSPSPARARPCPPVPARPPLKSAN